MLLVQVLPIFRRSRNSLTAVSCNVIEICLLASYVHSCQMIQCKAIENWHKCQDFTAICVKTQT